MGAALSCVFSIRDLATALTNIIHHCLGQPVVGVVWVDGEVVQGHNKVLDWRQTGFVETVLLALCRHVPLTQSHQVDGVGLRLR